MPKFYSSSNTVVWYLRSMISEEKVKKFIFPKLKFAGTSSIATIVDYTLFLVLAYSGLSKTIANLISASCGFLVNFFLQKRYIFIAKRKVQHAFLMSLSFSLLGIGISTLLIYLLSTIPFFDQYPFITKLLVTGVMFFYNYYTKQLAFEKKLKW